MKPATVLNRRRVLRGIGGVTVGLPLLESLVPRARAQAAEKRPVYSLFMATSCGVVPQRFWPRATGRLTVAGLRAESDRALSELADHADRLLLVKGVNHPFSESKSCAHVAGGCQTLTAQNTSGEGFSQRANGVSLEVRIAGEVNPDKREALGYWAGYRRGKGEFASFRAPGQIRALENNPWRAYQRLVGLDTPGNEALAKQIESRRKSVNDLVRGQLTDLMNNRALGREDRSRLDLHLTAVRDLEVRISSQLSPAREQAIKAISDSGQYATDVNVIKVAEMHMDLIALVFASDFNRTGVLQIGTGADRLRYTIDGRLMPAHLHQISHRIFSDGASGAPIAEAETLHHLHDRMFARAFRYLLDRLAAHPTPTGTLLDDSFCVWANELGTGPTHSRTGIPHVIGGRAGGFFKTGYCVDLGGVKSNKVLSTYVTAAGCRKSNGGPVDDFGHASLEKGLVSELMA